MKPQYLIWLLIGMWLQTQTALAQLPAYRGYAIGDIVAADMPLQRPDGTATSLDAYRMQQGVILIFTRPGCPFDRAYANRIEALSRQMQLKNVPVLLVLQTSTPADTAYTYSTANVVIDKDRTVAHRFGATRTPEVFVLKQTNGQLILEYSGSLDDNPQDEQGVRRRYVEEAITQLLAGNRVALPVTKPIGCGLR